ncbi:MAG: hypothetical protein V4709_06170 [Pseudomonadota bacterium]
MPSIAIPKTLLSLVLLSVILWQPLRAEEPLRVYRFGSWTLLTPAEISPETLASGREALPIGSQGLELLAYWQDGSQRALALRFDGSDAKQDAVVMKSFRRVNSLKGCKFGPDARLKPFKKMLPKDAEPVDFPDDGGLQLVGSERGLRRNGEVLVLDLGTARVQLSEDSPVVRVGEWNSADFCRFELLARPDEPEDAFEELRF